MFFVVCRSFSYRRPNRESGARPCLNTNDRLYGTHERIATQAGRRTETEVPLYSGSHEWYLACPSMYQRVRTIFFTAYATSALYGISVSNGPGQLIGFTAVSCCIYSHKADWWICEEVSGWLTLKSIGNFKTRTVMKPFFLVLHRVW